MKKLLVLTLLFLIVASGQMVLPQVAKAEYYHKVITVEDRVITQYNGHTSNFLIVSSDGNVYDTRVSSYAFLKPKRNCKVQINSEIYMNTSYPLITKVFQCYN